MTLANKLECCLMVTAVLASSGAGAAHGSIPAVGSNVSLDLPAPEPGRSWVSCCRTDGTCVLLEEQVCLAEGGLSVWECLGDSDSDGVDDACEPQACCYDFGACEVVSPPECAALLGVSQGLGTGCAGPIPCCLGGADCWEMDPLCCLSWGGAQGTGAECLGDPDGDGVDEACELPEAYLLDAVPADQQSLSRSQKNAIRLTFDADMAAPETGQLLIQRMWDGGAFGGDLSANFTFTVENDGTGQPRVLKMVETVPCLTHQTWVAVRNLGAPAGWPGVEILEVQYVVMVGDVNNDSKVLATDLSAIFPKIPTAHAADQERADVNGDGKVLATDLSTVFPRIPSQTPNKPSGH